MRYEEYRITTESGLEKKLGILGETHVYRPEETAFSREIISGYDVFASEGSQRLTPRNICLGMTLLPWYFLSVPFFKKERRSFRNLTALKLAKEENKRILYFNDTKHIGIGKMLMMASIPFVFLASLPFLPFIGLYRKITKRQRAEPEGEGRGIINKIIDYLVSSKKRDSYMAEKTIGYLHDSNNLLIGCGLNHMKGIIRNLSENPDVKSLTKISERMPVYNSGSIIHPIEQPVYAY